MAMRLDQFRAQYPQYNDMSDEQLAQSLHQKYYSDVPFDQFQEQVRPLQSDMGTGEYLGRRFGLGATIGGAITAEAAEETLQDLRQLGGDDVPTWRGLIGLGAEAAEPHVRRASDALWGSATQQAEQFTPEERSFLEALDSPEPLSALGRWGLGTGAEAIGTSLPALAGGVVFGVPGALGVGAVMGLGDIAREYEEQGIDDPNDFLKYGGALAYGAMERFGLGGQAAKLFRGRLGRPIAEGVRTILGETVTELSQEEILMGLSQLAESGEEITQEKVRDYFSNPDNVRRRIESAAGGFAGGTAFAPISMAGAALQGGRDVNQPQSDRETGEQGAGAQTQEEARAREARLPEEYQRERQADAGRDDGQAVVREGSGQAEESLSGTIASQPELPRAAYEQTGAPQETGVSTEIAGIASQLPRRGRPRSTLRGTATAETVSPIFNRNVRGAGSFLSRGELVDIRDEFDTTQSDGQGYARWAPNLSFSRAGQGDGGQGPRLYSLAQEQVETLPPGTKMSGEQWLGWFSNRPVRGLELDETGLREDLQANPKQQYSRDDIMAQLRDNALQIERVVRSTRNLDNELGNWRAEKIEDVVGYVSSRAAEAGRDLTPQQLDEAYRLVDRLARSRPAEDPNSDTSEVTAAVSALEGFLHNLNRLGVPVSAYYAENARQLLNPETFYKTKFAYRDWTTGEGEYDEIYIKYPDNKFGQPNTKTIAQVLASPTAGMPSEVRKEATNKFIERQFESAREANPAVADEINPSMLRNISWRHGPGAGFYALPEASDLTKGIVDHLNIQLKQSPYEVREAVHEFMEEALPETIGAYTSGHFGNQAPNIIAHARTREVTLPNGEKALYVEELQSDWAKDIKKGDTNLSTPLLRSDQGWVETAVRQVIDYAVDQGYHYVSFTTPAERFRLYGGGNPKTKKFFEILYGRVVPNFVKKYAKKLGGKVETVDIERFNKSYNVDSVSETNIRLETALSTEGMGDKINKFVDDLAAEMNEFVFDLERSDLRDTVLDIVKDQLYTESLETTPEGKVTFTPVQIASEIWQNLGDLLVDPADRPSTASLTNFVIRVGPEFDQDVYDNYRNTANKRLVEASLPKPQRLTLELTANMRGHIRCKLQRLTLELTANMRGHILDKGQPAFSFAGSTPAAQNETARRTLQAVQRIWKEVAAPGAKLRIHNQLTAADTARAYGMSEAQLKRALESTGATGVSLDSAIAGYHTRGIVGISLDNTMRRALGTVYHEVFHFLDESGIFTANERAILGHRDNRTLEETPGSEMPRIRRIAKRYLKQLGSSESELANLTDYEARAYASEAYNLARRTGEGLDEYSNALARIFEKPFRFFRRLGNALRGMGFQTAEDIFDRVRTGQIQQRRASRNNLRKVLNDNPNFSVSTGVVAKTLGMAKDRFVKWFGNSAVTDQNGMPLQLYHGSPANNITSFDPARTDPGGIFGQGIYMTDNAEVAAGYAGNLTELDDVAADLEESRAELADINTKIKRVRQSDGKLADPELMDWGLMADEALENLLKYRTELQNLISEMENHNVNPTVYPVYTNLKNVFEADEPMSQQFKDELAQMVDNANIPEWLKAQYIDGIYSGQTPNELSVNRDTRGLGPYIAELARQKGFDGLHHTGGTIWDGDKHNVYISFYGKDQIKSQFNQDPDNIDFSVSVQSDMEQAIDKVLADGSTRPGSMFDWMRSWLSTIKTPQHLASTYAPFAKPYELGDEMRAYRSHIQTNSANIGFPYASIKDKDRLQKINSAMEILRFAGDRVDEILGRARLTSGEYLIDPVVEFEETYKDNQGVTQTTTVKRSVVQGNFGRPVPTTLNPKVGEPVRLTKEDFEALQAAVRVGRYIAYENERTILQTNREYVDADFVTNEDGTVRIEEVGYANYDYDQEMLQDFNKREAAINSNRAPWTAVKEIADKYREMIRKVEDGEVMLKNKGDLEQLNRILAPIARLERQLFQWEHLMRRAYHPRMRFGNHFITVRDKTGAVVWFEGTDDMDFKKPTLTRSPDGTWMRAVGLNKGKAKERLREIYSQLREIGYRVEDLQGDVSAASPELIEGMVQNGNFSFEDLAGLLNMEQLRPYKELRNKIEEALIAQGPRRHMLESKGILGYDTDFKRSIANYIASSSGFIARRRYNSPLRRAINDMPDRMKHQRRYKRYAVKWGDYIQSPQEEFAALRMLGFSMYLGMNFSSALLQWLTLPQFASPYMSMTLGDGPARTLGRGLKLGSIDAGLVLKKLVGNNNIFPKIGVAGAISTMHVEEFRKALRKMKPGWSDEKVDVMTQWVKQFWDDGKLKPLMTLEQAGMQAGGEGMTRGLGQKTAEILAVPFERMEMSSRLAFLLAYGDRILDMDQQRFQKYLQDRAAANPRFNESVMNPRNLSVFESARSYVDDPYRRPFELKNEQMFQSMNFALDEVFGMYGKNNRAPYMRGFGAPLFQFQNWPQQMTELMGRLITNESKVKGSRQAVLTIAFQLWLFGGLFGLPVFIGFGGDDARELIEGMWRIIARGLGMSGADMDIETFLRRNIADLPGVGSPEFAEILLRGPVRSTGIDLSQRASLASTPAGQWLNTVMRGEFPVHEAMGVAGSIPGGFIAAGQRMQAGDPAWRALAIEATPLFMRNIAQSVDWNARGVTSRRGNVVVPPDEIGASEQLLRAVGFNPTEVAQAREATYRGSLVAQQARESGRRYKERLIQIITRLVRARRSGDQEAVNSAVRDRQRLMSDIREYNAGREPADRVRIDVAALTREVGAQLRPELRNIEYAPRAARRRVMETQELYNPQEE